MRCQICDHLEGFGSHLNPLVHPSTKVRYNKTYGAYLCDDCAEAVNSAYDDPQIDEDGEEETLIEETEELPSAEIIPFPIKRTDEEPVG